MDFLNKDDDTKRIYKLVGKHMNGELVGLMRNAIRTNDYSNIDR